MKNYKHVADCVKSDELVKFTQELVRINSVFDPKKEGANEETVADYIAEFLIREGFEVHVEDVAPGRPNVIAFLRGKEPGKTLLFEGHTDVVTAGDLDQWKYDPFGAEIVGDRIYGRGTCDTKGNVAAAIYAAKAVKDSGEHFKGDILLCIPCDEEGMMTGIKNFIRRGWADHVDAAVICEPEENHICIFQKGAMRAEVRVYGKQSHGAMPLTGINPNWRLARIICELEKLEQAEKDRLGCHEYLKWPSITPTIITSPAKGEAQINVVPGEAYMTLDIRTVPGQNHNELKQKILDIYAELGKNDPDFKATLNIIEERPWTSTPKDAEITKVIYKAVEEITGKEPVWQGVPGATDGTFLHVMKGIPVIVIGAGDTYIPHHADEYVDIPELIETAKIYALTSMYFLNEEL
ncbi:MAG TPA: M20 family metallopeptidase [Anaerovoracaceae bacterium]|nr:M20 family metallopeptidase [Anaerovoracaceae bacterium]